MMIGDLVRVRRQPGAEQVPAHLDFALVVAVRAAWPGELELGLLYPDGREETWYDSQLEVVSENTGA